MRNVGPPVSTAAYEYEAEISHDGRTLVAVVDRGDRSHLYRFERDGRVAGSSAAAFPRSRTYSRSVRCSSPTADRLLFAQADGARSGELFLIDLVERPDERWPACSGATTR